MKAWLRLARVQNLPTAIADPVAGALILAAPGELCVGRALALAGVSALLYSAGMVLNDVADVGRDRELHPGRPLVAGEVPVARAAIVGVGLLVLALLSAMAVGFGAAFVATLIALFVLLYDFTLKRARLAGCLAMGILRGLNVALGMSALFDEAKPLREVARDPLLLAPALMAGYAFLLTLLSTFEEGKGGRVGVPATLAATSLVPMAAILCMQDPSRAAIAAMAMALLFLGRAALSVRRFDPSRTGLLVRDGVRAIPLLDGMLVLGHGNAIGGLAVMALALPAVALGRWFKGA